VPSTSFRLISTVVTILLLVGLVLVVRLTLLSNPMTVSNVARTIAPVTTNLDRPTSPPSATPRALARAALSSTVAFELAGVQQVETGGFSFRPLIGYTLELQNGSVNMLSPTENVSGATSAAREAFLLSGGVREQFAPAAATSLEEIFEQYVNFYAEKDNFSIGVEHAITIDGVAGFAVDLTSSDAARSFAGRIAMAQPLPTQIFVMVGVAPTEQWQTTTVKRFQAVLDAVQLFALRSAITSTVTPASTRSSNPAATRMATPLATAPLRLTSTVPISRTPGWQTLSNANRINDLTFYTSTLWAATQGGMLAWNMQTNRTAKFTTLDGPAVNQATAVVACPLPGLGIVFGSDQGLQIFDTQTGRWKGLNSSNSTMSFDDVAALVCSVEYGFLLVGYQQHGLDIFDARTGTWRYANQTRAAPKDVLEQLVVVGNRDAIWIASSAGVSVLTEAGNKTFDSTNSPLASDAVTAMAVDADDTIWLGARDALYKVSGDDWTVYSQLSVLASSFPAGDINGLAVAADGTLWLGSSQGEICHFDPVEAQCQAFFASGKSTTDGMARGELTALTLDPLGNVYYATNGGGMSRYDGLTWRTFRLPDEVVAGNRVHDLAEAADGSIWLATNGGIQQINPSDDATMHLFTPENSGLAVAETGLLKLDPEGGLWFGAQAANYFNGTTWSVYNRADGLAGNRVQALAIDNQQRIWFGTPTGLSVWNGNTFFNLTEANGLPSADVTALLPDDDTMWIGSNGGGLFRFAQNRLQLFSPDQLALPSDVITALALANDKTLLVGTNRGIARVQDGTATLIAEIAGFAITAIGVTEGDELWVGTRDNGLLYFDGERWTQPPDNVIPPSPHVTAILVDQVGSVWVGSVSGGLIRYQPPAKNK